MLVPPPAPYPKRQIAATSRANISIPTPEPSREYGIERLLTLWFWAALADSRNDLKPLVPQTENMAPSVNIDSSGEQQPPQTKVPTFVIVNTAPVLPRRGDVLTMRQLDESGLKRAPS